MIKVGIVGENYDNDSVALKKLLEKRYDANQVQFVPLLKGTSGDKLESKGIKRILEETLKRKSKKGKIHFIIFFRDLDSLPDDKEQIKKRQAWFDFIKLHKLDIFFLAIYEAETLVLADIQTFNQMYGTTIAFKSNPLFQKEPKEFLKQHTFKAKKKYQESHLADIFEQLDFTEIYANHCHADHPCFQSFIDELDEKLA